MAWETVARYLKDHDERREEAFHWLLNDYLEYHIIAGFTNLILNAEIIIRLADRGLQKDGFTGELADAVRTARGAADALRQHGSSTVVFIREELRPWWQSWSPYDVVAWDRFITYLAEPLTPRLQALEGLVDQLTTLPIWAYPNPFPEDDERGRLFGVLGDDPPERYRNMLARFKSKLTVDGLEAHYAVHLKW